MNILVVTYWSFSDPLVQTYTLPYVRLIQKCLPAGSQIFLFCLSQEAYETDRDQEEVKKRYAEKENIHLVFSKYDHFGAKMLLKMPFILLKLWNLCRRNRIDYIHTWCTPGGTIGYLLSVLTGKPLIADSFEPHAEYMADGGTWKRSGLAFNLLYWFERRMAKSATAVIGLTRYMKDYASEKYGVKLEKYYIKPSCVDFKTFDYRKPVNEELKKQLGLEGKIVCVYAGKVGGIYLEREIFDFFKAASDHWGDRFRALFLTKTSHEEAGKYCRLAGLDPQVIVQKFVDHSQISDYMRLADFALNPVKPGPSRRYCTSIKDGEYWGSGLPVVITPGISEDSDIIAQHDIGAVLTSLEPGAYMAAVQKIDELLKQPREALAEKIFNVGRLHRSFSNAEKIYREIYCGK